MDTYPFAEPATHIVVVGHEMVVFPPDSASGSFAPQAPSWKETTLKADTARHEASVGQEMATGEIATYPTLSEVVGMSLVDEPQVAPFHTAAGAVSFAVWAW
jgi:hypothetical protein